MTSLWLDLLLTPMAAPGSQWLRAMRVALLAGFVAVALGVLNLAYTSPVVGRARACLLAGLCVAPALLVSIYAGKVRTNAAYLNRLGRAKEP